MPPLKLRQRSLTRESSAFCAKSSERKATLLSFARSLARIAVPQSSFLVSMLRRRRHLHKHDKVPFSLDIPFSL